MSISVVFISEAAYKKSLTLINKDDDSDSDEGNEYSIKTRTNRKGTAKNDEFKLWQSALQSRGTLALDGGKGHDELSFDSANSRKIVLNTNSQIKSISVEQNGTFKKAKNTSFANFERYEFDGKGNVTLDASAKRTIKTGTLLEIGSGSGADRITFGDITFKGSSGTSSVTGLEIDTDKGKDVIQLGNIVIKNNGYVTVDAGSGNDHISIGKVLAPKGIVYLEGGKGSDVYDITSGNTAKILIEEEGSASDTINISGVEKSRFSNPSQASSNLSFALKSRMDDGKKEYCLTVRGVSKTEGAGGSFSIAARSFKGDTLRLLAHESTALASIDLAKVASQLKEDGKFHKLSFEKIGKITSTSAKAPTTGSITFSSAQKSLKKSVLAGTPSNANPIVYNSTSNIFKNTLSTSAPTQSTKDFSSYNANKNTGLASAN